MMYEEVYGTPMRKLFLSLTTVLYLVTADQSVQAADPPCVPSIKNQFSRGLCAETVVSSDPSVERLESHGIASISGLAFGADGVLYLARPATSEILRLVPDGKGRFLPPQVFAAKLSEPPNGLAYDPTERAWYVSAQTTITRLRDQDGDGTADDQQMIVRDLPGGIGGWLGNVRIGPDLRSGEPPEWHDILSWRCLPGFSQQIADSAFRVMKHADDQWLRDHDRPLRRSQTRHATASLAEFAACHLRCGAGYDLVLSVPHDGHRHQPRRLDLRVDCGGTHLPIPTSGVLTGEYNTRDLSIDLLATFA
jgi:hypothetical protein